MSYVSLDDCLRSFLDYIFIYIALITLYCYCIAIHSMHMRASGFGSKAFLPPTQLPTHPQTQGSTEELVFSSVARK